MKDYIKAFNKKKVVYSKEKVFKSLDYNSRLYFDSCSSLYELGYLSSPFDFTSDFWSVLFEEDGDAPSLFINKRTGGMEFNAVRAKQVADSTKGVVYQLLYNVLSAKDNINALTQFAENVTSRYKLYCDEIYVHPIISLAGGIGSISKLPLDSPVIIDCIKSGVKAIPISYIAYNNILQEWGIESDGRSIFMGDDYTAEDDILNLKYLISGAVSGTGTHISDLYDMVSSYEATEQGVNGYDFYTYMLYGYDDGGALLGELSSRSPLYFTDTFIYQEEESVIQGSVWAKPDYIGTDLVDALTGDSLPVSCRLLGYTGKYVPLEYKSCLGLYGANIGVEMLGRFYYPVLDTIDYAMPPTLQCISVDDVCRKLDVSSIESLSAEVASVVTFVHPLNPEGFRGLVGKLFLSLVCVIADYTIQGQKSPNHIVWGSDYDWVTQDDYNLACREAERLYNLLF